MKTAFVFSGQGAQKVGMGKDLYDNSPAARAIFDSADSALEYGLSDIIFNGPEESLTETIHCQPAIYTMSLACLAAFRERNPELKPVACAGLSLGEYAAFAAAGSYLFWEGLNLVAARARFMEEACKANPGGSMAAIIGGTKEMVQEVCAQFDIDVANYNSPGQIVISGMEQPVLAACAELKQRGVKRALPLKVSGAFHSRWMTPAAEALQTTLADTAFSMPSQPVIHNYTAAEAVDPDAIRDTLKHQVNGSVRWDDSVRLMAERYGAECFIEFGPGNVLTGLIKKILPDAVVKNVGCMADLD